MSPTIIRIMLVLALALLAVATWINEVAIADAMFIFAAFSIGGVWAKYSRAAPQTI
ncbi:MAG: hypothetical protein AAGA08_20140 [Pseudomonadota bacterium]